MQKLIQYVAIVLAACTVTFFTNAQVTFEKVPVVSLPDDPQELAKGDFNNDGLIDFVAVNFNSFANQQVTILLNSGSGTFSGANKRNFASATNAIDVAVGDFNEDGNLDVVTCSQSNNNFSLLLGDGSGNLSAPINFAAGDSPQGITVGDMNKDDNLDVLVSNRGTPNDVYIFLGNGTGGFSAPTIIAIANVWDIAVADFNNDTNPDFAVVVNGSPGTVSIRFGDGSGTTYTTGPVITGFATAEDLIAVNLDGDSDIDILAGAGYSLNDGSGNFGTRVILNQTNYEYTVADVNGDTHPDIISNDNNSNRPHVRVFLGDGLGAFSLLAKFETTALANGLEVGDVNNDGLADIVNAGSWNGGDGNVDVLLGEGNGYFSNAILKYPTVTDPRDMVKGDFNEDGLIDIALCHSANNIVTIYLGLPGGKFSKTTVNYSTGTFPSSLKVFDYNNDSHLDLITLNQSASSVTVLTGAGDGSFSALGNFSVTTIAGSRLEVADFNNDNIPDIAVSGFTNNLVNVLLGTGSGFNSPITSSLSQNVSEIKAADYNGDGNVDLAAQFNNIFKMVLLTGNGAGAFTETATQYPCAGSFFLAEDINNDTHTDVIAFTNSSTGSDYFINDGTGNFVGTAMPSSLGGFPWAFEDMDGDGLKDLIVGAQNSISSEPGQVLIFRGTGTAISTTLLIDHDLSGGNRLVVHDVNADGKLDVITTSFNIYEDYLGVLINTTGAPICTPPGITSLSPASTLCQGQQITFSVSATGTAPLSYSWRLGGIPITGATNPTYSINNAAISNSGQYSVLVSNACGSVVSNNVTLTVNSSPTAPIANNAASCNPASITLNASGGTNGNYRWYTAASGGSPITGETNSSFTTPTLSTTTTYYVSLASGGCESVRTSITVTIGGVACSNQPPAISSTNASTTIAGNVTIDLSTLASDPDNNIDINSFKIITNPISNAIATITNGILVIDYSGNSFSGTDQLTIEVCDLLGSCAQTVISIVVVGGLQVYNGISPNGDPYNEKWIILNIESLPDTQDNKVSIYNRWGDLIFETTNYDNSERVFKGLNKNGDEVPSGIYFYKIEFDSDRPALNGYLTVKR
ncbi:MAG: FG-GAP-like repeat-containing protein [Cyclobacteriaceae bacterium]